MCHNSHASLESILFPNIISFRKHFLIPPKQSFLHIDLAKDILPKNLINADTMPCFCKRKWGKWRSVLPEKCFQAYTAVENPEVHMCPREESLGRGLQGKGQLWRGHTNLPPNTNLPPSFLTLHFFFGFLTEDVTHCCRDLGNKMHH